MVTDTERNYTGTNFVVIALGVLLFAVLSFLLVAQGRDVADDGIGQAERQSAVR